MARHKHGAKSAAIREYLSENPGAMPKAVVEALRAKGLRVTPQMVSTIKGKTSGRRGRHASNGKISADSLIQAKLMANRLGGIARAQEALAVLAKLV
jgi:protoporphyrinogen oxidase